ncbi:MAG TPA: PAS domain S-box protein [Spirochaetota bacterium]|nr:PAS domain S-box protein [Spirochaetota bacterium]HPV41322.1 PAS domain S-box protein [Spirochaetota bacterium]
MEKPKKKPAPAGKQSARKGNPKKAGTGLLGGFPVQRLIESIPDMFVYSGLDGTIRIVSRKTALQHGYRQVEDLVGMNAMDLIAPEEHPQVAEAMKKIIETETLIMEHHLIRKDGTRFPAEVTLSLVRDEDGRPRGIASIARDMTDRKRAEAALQESEERYRQISQLSVDYFFKIDISPDGAPRLSYVSENITAITGRRQDEITGLDQWIGIIHPDDREQFLAFYRAVMAGGRKGTFECRSFLKSGAMRWISVSVYPTADPGSRRVTSILGTVKDITERKRAEEKVRETQRQLEFLLDVTKTGIDIIDENLNVLYVDPGWQKVYGDPQGKKCHEYFMDRDEICPGCGIPESLKTKKHTVTEEILPRENNRIIEVHTIPFKNSDGKWLVAEFNIDITERKKAEDRLTSSLREKETLLKEIHHRVKNNMQVITSLLSLQAQYLGDAEMTKHFLEAENRIRSMALVHEKLYQSEDLGQIDFSLYLSELANTIMYSYSRISQSITMDIDARPVRLPVDQAIPAGLLVTELLTNAIKHAFPACWSGTPEVLISLRELDGAMVELSIRDNGIGLPEDKGIGEAKTLGLSLVPMLAGQINGEVTLDRSRGTAFTITFRRQ